MATVMTHKELALFAVEVYRPIAMDDIHWLNLVMRRPVAHLREVGYEVIRIDFNIFKVSKP